MKYYCLFCGKEFNNKKSMTNHKRWHNPNKKLVEGMKIMIKKRNTEKWKKKLSETCKAMNFKKG